MQNAGRVETAAINPSTASLIPAATNSQNAAAIWCEERTAPPKGTAKRRATEMMLGTCASIIVDPECQLEPERVNVKTQMSPSRVN